MSGLEIVLSILLVIFIGRSEYMRGKALKYKEVLMEVKHTASGMEKEVGELKGRILDFSRQQLALKGGHIEADSPLSDEWRDIQKEVDEIEAFDPNECNESRSRCSSPTAHRDIRDSDDKSYGQNNDHQSNDTNSNDSSSTNDSSE